MLKYGLYDEDRKSLQSDPVKRVPNGHSPLTDSLPEPKQETDRTDRTDRRTTPNTVYNRFERNGFFIFFVEEDNV